ncbi:hypothetical protein BCR44DRAFT_27564 [Catenaria anguillulae PL171]|uniref:ER membrane protein complex subunit 10 n=1 Tax=Catenaria anguillulae PL171 TaxID=765915 RepID=A0A1Y2HHT2_9FUNG|nr:hypothetical protein BCR44DRAFT_27564 [Catenaria anguillulae PL171]
MIQHQRQRQHQPRDRSSLLRLLSLAAATLLAAATFLSHPASAQPSSNTAKILHDALSKPTISKSFSVQHALIPNAALVANWGKLPASTSWSPKTALILDAHDPPAPAKGGAAPSRPSQAGRVWVAKVDVTRAQAQAHAAAGGGLTVTRPADAMYAVRIVGDEVKNQDTMVRLYPACWVSSSDSIRMHIDESGSLFAFDWVPGSQVCSESDKVIVDMRTEAQVAVPKLLPRPLKPVPPSAKLATPRPRLKTGYKPPAKPTGTVTTDGNGGTDSESVPPEAQEAEPAAGREMDDEPELGDVDVEDKPDDRRSFLSKYWMYIVPVILLVIMGGPAEEPKKAGAGGGAGGGGARAAKQ